MSQPIPARPPEARERAPRPPLPRPRSALAVRAVRREDFPALLALCEAQSRMEGAAAGAAGAGRGYASADPIELHDPAPPIPPVEVR